MKKQNTKATTTKIKISRLSATAVGRLSRQLRMSPEALITKALTMAIKTIDNAVAHQVNPFEGCLVNDFDCTAKLNSLTDRQLANLADVHPVPQIALLIRSDRRRGIRTRR